MKFERKNPVPVPFKDVFKGNIFREPNDENLYVKINDDKALCLTNTLMLSYKYFGDECEVLGKNFEDFIERLKKNEYKKKKIKYLFSDEIIFGSLFECDKGIYIKINENDKAVCLDSGRVVQLDCDTQYRIIEDYKMEIFE